ncbi:MAG: thioredoxin domain-containing protein [Gammaproteobacteria bacterium]
MPTLNRLARESSPYLQQHAGNPVDWYPWCDEALERARRENKPILLSIGYSACHWCHVMAHESFEDPDIGALMNANYINIKVDREERPDLDKIYQLAHQLLTQRPGGWPLTVFLTPDDHTPFFAGTYFPRSPRYGIPSFPEVLQAVAGYYRERRNEVTELNGRLHEALEAIQHQHPPADELPLEALKMGREELEQSYEPVFGGFGGAPKFPQPAALERLLEHWYETGVSGEPDPKALEMASHSLSGMARGGLQDQLGGGFYRYSVDERWMIPHFEKMLYDNGPLLHLYACASQIDPDGGYAEVARRTGDWVLREMRAPEGGFYSTLDADSEGHEGRFYVWTREEIRDQLDEQALRVAQPAWGLDQRPNFEGRWHLHLAKTPPQLAKELGIDATQVAERIEQARQRLFAARERRERPHRDEKILTAWNGLMIKGLASAGRRLGESRFIDAAAAALDFLRRSLWDNGRLWASFKDGQARHNGYLDDYAFLLDGVLELLQARWSSAHLAFAIDLAEALLTHFEDRERGGFYFTAADHERLLFRPKPYGDDATPSGNGIAALCLTRLGHLLGEPRYLEAAENTLKAAASAIRQAPAWHNTLLRALREAERPPDLVILTGPGADLDAWRREFDRDYRPHRLLFAIPEEENHRPPPLDRYRGSPGRVTAFVCRGTHCSPPVHDRGELASLLG